MRRPTRNHRLQLVIVLGVATLLALSGDLTLYAILPVNAGGLLLTLAQVGVLLSANRLIRLLSNPLTGFLLDKGKRRPIILYGLLLGTLSTLVYAFTRQFFILLLGRMMWGFAWSFINVGGNTMVIDSTQQGGRGHYIGVLNTLVSLGLALNPLLGGFLADAVGFRPTMLVCALLTGAGFLLALFLLPETHPGRPDTIPSEEPNEDQPVSVGTRSAWITALFNFKLKDLSWETWLAIILTLIFSFTGNGLILGTIGRFLALELPQGALVGGTLLGVSTLAGMTLSGRSLLIAITAPLSGVFSDREKTRWTGVLVALVLGVVGMLALGGLPTTPALVVGITLVSICEGVLFTVLPAIVGDGSSESQRGRAIGLTFVAGDLGAALAPILVYSLLSLIPLRSIYLASASAFGLGLVLVVIQGLCRGRVDD